MTRRSSGGSERMRNVGYPEQYRDIELNPAPAGPVLDMDCRGENHRACIGPPGTQCGCSCHAFGERGRMTEHDPLLPPPGAQLRPLGEVSLDVGADDYWDGDERR